ncbi:MAG: hypothetical protein HY644_10345 [Acidobacteria bacterium]|nr:hypothetical protein [Acidobacteriota bacterium]
MRIGTRPGLVLPLLLGLFSTVFADGGTGIVSGAVNDPSAKRFPTLVYLEGIPDQKLTPPAINPTITQKQKTFLPGVLPVLVGTTVEFLNNDGFDHNVFSPDGEKYDLGTWGKGKRSYTFKQPGVYTQLCKLHPEMIAYVVVLKTPSFAVVDEAGKFRIPNVPAGAWKLKVWNERLKPIQLGKPFAVQVTAGQEAKIEVTF